MLSCKPPITAACVAHVLLVGLMHAQQLPTPVVYYRLDGDAIDSGPHSNHGSIVGNPIASTDRFGNPNGAMRFQNGSGVGGYIQASAANLPTDALTVSLWFHAESLTYPPSLFGYGADCYHALFLAIDLSGSGGANAYAAYGHCDGPFAPATYATPPIHRWVHWAITRDSAGYVTTYINGTVVATETLHNMQSTHLVNAFNENVSLFLGAAGDINGTHPHCCLQPNLFDGSLDDVYVFDTALTPAQIAMLAQHGAASITSIGATCYDPNAFLSASPLPRIGSLVQWTVTTNTNTQWGVMLRSLETASPPTDLSGLGMPGCLSYLTGTIAATFFTSSPIVFISENIPAAPWAAGLDLTGQAILYSPPSTPIGLIATNGLTLTAGF